MAKNMFAIRGMTQGAFLGVFLFLLFAVLNFTTSCSNNAKAAGSDDTTAAVAKDTTDELVRPSGAFLTDNQFPVLYITNINANDSLAKLFKSVPGASLKKWVFQFFRDTAGKLRILVIPTRTGGVFVPEGAVITLVSDSVVLNPYPNENVFLGDLQFGDRPRRPIEPPHGPKDTTKALSFLSKHVYPNQSTGWEYIWFVPDVYPIDVTIGGSVIKRNYVLYHVFVSNEKPSKAATSLVTVTANLDFANPSPPRQGY